MQLTFAQIRYCTGLRGRTTGVGGWKRTLLFNNSSVMYRCIQTRKLFSRISGRSHSLNYVWYHACYQQLLLTTQTLISNYKGLTICECARSFGFAAKQTYVGKQTPQWMPSEPDKLFIYLQKKRAHAFRSRTRFQQWAYYYDNIAYWKWSAKRVELN